MTQTYDIPRVHIEVVGGVAHVVRKDPGVIVRITDFDDEAEDSELTYELGFDEVRSWGRPPLAHRNPTIRRARETGTTGRAGG